MNNCIICNKQIDKDAQFINGKWYHNNCIEQLQRENNILTDFEKWLEERYKQQTETLNKMEEDNIERPYVKSRRYLVEECLDKLQELKEGKK